MNDKQTIIKRIRDCDNCKFRPETSRVCSNYENCYMVSEYICKLRNQLKRKEQECFQLANIYHCLVKIANHRLNKIEDLQQQLEQLKAEKLQAEQKLKRDNKIMLDFLEAYYFEVENE